MIQLTEETVAATIQAGPQAFAETIDLHALESETQATADEDLPELTSLGTLGRFRLLKQLGQGSFGRVYLAFDPQLDRQVALKVPTFESHETRKIQRFISEAKAAARLRHPNIVPTYESGLADGQYYIASQYIAGQTLAARLSSNPPDFRQAAEWVRQLAEGLAYAHTQAIVHRDIKPANIMIDEHDVPQIMDFGLAKRLNDDAAMTIDGTVLGTPAYMPPEQARGDTSQVNAASDQYSLGVVLYELLTGERPFNGPSHAVLSSVLTQEPPTPRDRRKEIPRDLDAICQMAMSKQQARRYASTQHLAQDLQAWLSEIPTRARAVSIPERFSGWVRRNPAISSLVGLVLLLLVVGASVSTTLAWRAIQNLELAQRHERSLRAAISAAETETRRANAEAQRALEREQEAIIARNEATAAQELAAQRATRLQSVLDELQASQQLVASKEATVAKATSEVADARARLANEALVDRARVAFQSNRFAESRELLQQVEVTQRNEEWNDLSRKSAPGLAKQISTSKKPSQLHALHYDRSKFIFTYSHAAGLTVEDVVQKSTLLNSASTYATHVIEGSIFMKRSEQPGHRMSLFDPILGQQAADSANEFKLSLDLAKPDCRLFWIERDDSHRNPVRLWCWHQNARLPVACEVQSGATRMISDEKRKVLMDVAPLEPNLRVIGSDPERRELCFYSSGSRALYWGQVIGDADVHPRFALTEGPIPKGYQGALRGGVFATSSNPLSRTIYLYSSADPITELHLPDEADDDVRIGNIWISPLARFVAAAWGQVPWGPSPGGWITVWEVASGKIVATQPLQKYIYSQNSFCFDNHNRAFAWLHNNNLYFMELPALDSVDSR